MKPYQTSLLALVITVMLAPAANSDAAGRVLPFQGRLTLANGDAIPDGSRVVQFKIYDAPVGGKAVWNGEVHNLSVNAGLVSTLLGTKAGLAAVDFNQDLYLELTIDANGDGQISLTDPPLLPRQSILPAIFAHEAGNALALEGYNWTSLFGSNNPAEGTLLSSKIADASLTAAKIQDGAITSAKLANGAVLRTKIDTNGALAGQSLKFNGTGVVWDQVNAINAVNSDTLDGLDWSSALGSLNVAGLFSRGGITAEAGLSVRGDVTLGLNGNWLRSNGSILAVNIISSTDLQAFRDCYARSFVPTSDRNAKENFTDIVPAEVLAKVVTLPITRWNFKGDSAQHMGPVSQDFRSAFHLGVNDKTIATVDADGVALAAIQGLNSKVDQRNNEFQGLLKQQQEQIDTLKAEIAALRSARQ